VGRSRGTGPWLIRTLIALSSGAVDPTVTRTSKSSQ
jgi:hypothetical protein